jgi:hypothetical protein
MPKRVPKPDFEFVRLRLKGPEFISLSLAGWAAVIIYLVILVLLFLRIDTNSRSTSDTLISFIPVATLLTMILIFITYKFTLRKKTKA